MSVVHIRAKRRASGTPVLGWWAWWCDDHDAATLQILEPQGVHAPGLRDEVESRVALHLRLCHGADRRAS